MCQTFGKKKLFWTLVIGQIRIPSPDPHSHTHILFFLKRWSIEITSFSMTARHHQSLIPNSVLSATDSRILSANPRSKCNFRSRRICIVNKALTTQMLPKYSSWTTHVLLSCVAAPRAAVATDGETAVTTPPTLRKKLNKVVLAYSGGLDTSVIVPWLRWVGGYTGSSPYSGPAKNK